MSAGCPNCAALQRLVTELQREVDDRQLSAFAELDALGRAIGLGRSAEVRLLAWFLAHPGLQGPRAWLAEAAGFAESAETDRAVDTYICRLRKALDRIGLSGVIRTHYASGYSMSAADVHRVRQALAQQAVAA